MVPMKRELSVDLYESIWETDSTPPEPERGVVDSFTGIVISIVLGVAGWGLLFVLWYVSPL